MNLGDPKTWIALIMVSGTIALALLQIPIPQWLPIQTGMILAFYFQDRRTRSAAENVGQGRVEQQDRIEQYLAYIASKVEQGPETGKA